MRIYHRTRLVVSKTFKLKRDAEAWEAEQYRLLSSGDYVNPRSGDAPLADVVAAYLTATAGVSNPKTLDTVEAALRRHLPVELSRRPIRSIRAAQLDELYADRLRAGFARGTVSRFRDSLSSVLAWAVRQRMIGTNPVNASKVPRGQEAAAESVTPFTPRELADTIAAHRERNAAYADVSEFASLTGLRWGELAALRVSDVVDAPIAAVVVSRSKSDGYSVKAPKSGRTRRVPLTDRAAEIAEAHARGRDGGAPLFPAPRGGVMSEANYKRAVAWGETASGHRFHDLRHTAATRWLQAGIDVKTVATWLGHSNAAVTLRIYAHHTGHVGDAAAIALLKASENQTPDDRA